jgi:hypothetical protein
MKSAFPFFGGKSRAADLIWSRLGDVVNYVEPFAGSLAALLARPHYPFRATRTETVNDIDAYVANFWRAIQADPEAVCDAADCPVNEVDLHARHSWLHKQAERIERLKSDPYYFDARVAGYWCWGLSSWIGDNFCRPNPQASIPHLGDPGKGVNRQLPHLGDSGKGVNRKLPHLGTPGMGVNRKLPHLGDSGKGESVPGGCQDRRERLLGYFQQIADRLRGVRVCCGDWLRILGPSTTHRFGLTGVLLDPPYDVYGTGYGGSSVGISTAVREWAIANGDHPEMKIAVCGYVDEGHTFPESWECVEWKAQGGYNNSGDGKNRERERIWFSPACRRLEERGLFDTRR